MKINYEKSNTDVNISERVLNLYKIYGYESVAYKDYLKSRKIFESKITNSEIKQENQNLLARTKDEILTQSKDKITFFIMRALENDNICGYNCAYTPIDNPYAFDD